jgi:hypothetical protein
MNSKLITRENNKPIINELKDYKGITRDYKGADFKGITRNYKRIKNTSKKIINDF